MAAATVIDRNGAVAHLVVGRVEADPDGIPRGVRIHRVTVLGAVPGAATVLEGIVSRAAGRRGGVPAASAPSGRSSPVTGVPIVDGTPGGEEPLPRARGEQPGVVTTVAVVVRRVGLEAPTQATDAVVRDGTTAVPVPIAGSRATVLGRPGAAIADGTIVPAMIDRLAIGLGPGATHLAVARAAAGRTSNDRIDPSGRRAPTMIGRVPRGGRIAHAMVRTRIAMEAGQGGTTARVTTGPAATDPAHGGQSDRAVTVRRVIGPVHRVIGPVRGGRTGPAVTGRGRSDPSETRIAAHAATVVTVAVTVRDAQGQEASPGRRVRGPGASSVPRKTTASSAPGRRGPTTTSRRQGSSARLTNRPRPTSTPSAPSPDP
jgi:hypothetical protein